MKYCISKTLLSLSFLFIFFIVIGQPDNRPTSGPAFYFNCFQKYRDKNVDSALFYVRELAADPTYPLLLQDLLHNSFGQVFIKSMQKQASSQAEKEHLKKWTEASYAILNEMIKDNDKTLAATAMPIYFWTEIQKENNSDEELIKLTTEFITTQLSSDDLYNNRVGRYAFLIYQVISEREALKELADKLFTSTTTTLKNNQVDVDADTASRSVLEKRAWYRCLYAYSNFVKANEALKKKNIKEAGEYFKTAFDYSPDASDINHASAYFYDMVYLFGEEKLTFQDDYVNYLTRYSEDKKLTLSRLLTMSLTNPNFKEQLKSFYNTNFSKKKKFNDYWLENINHTAKKSPDIFLKKMDGTLFSSIKQKGSWILLDFWGTWCVPCRREHPDLEKFYKNIALSKKISLLTIACGDKEDRVSAYMKQSKYSFPVAMADNKIEKTFNIEGYPSKILITPQGKYLLIPFGIDWVGFVKKYVDL